MYLRSCQKNWQWASYWGWFNKNYTFACPDFHSSHRQHKNGLFHPPRLILLHCGQSKETTLQCCWGRPRERPRSGTTGKGGAGGCAERKGDSIWARSEGGGYDVRMLGKDRNVVSNAGALWLKISEGCGEGDEPVSAGGFKEQLERWAGNRLWRMVEGSWEVGFLLEVSTRKLLPCLSSLMTSQGQETSVWGFYSFLHEPCTCTLFSRFGP